jgi:hypothetical protein
VFDGHGKWEHNEDRPAIKPSAHATIYLQEEKLCDQEFEGETEGDVKAQVEAWAAARFSEIELALRSAKEEK